MTKQIFNLKKKKNPQKKFYTLFVFVDLMITSVYVLLQLSVLKNIFEEYTTLSLIIYGIISFFVSSIVASIIMYFTSIQSQKREKVVEKLLTKIADNDFDYEFLPTGDLQLDVEIDSFNKILKELKSVAILKEDFISNFSHEFKTPITSIKGFAEILQSKKDLTEEDKNEYLQIIIDESARLSNLSKNTLLMSKLDTQIMEEKRSVYCLDEQIRQTILLLDNEISAKNINIETNLEKVKIIANKEMLNHVWNNILTNAIKFTNDEIFIETKIENNKIKVLISDNGEGMNKETLNHIFEKYYQGDTSHKSSGNGLGLSIAKKVVELANGTIEVKSEINQGTTFIVSLPNELNKNS